ncbi:MAG: DEAD/DEAH box helicase [Thiolinea sp.]
MLEGHNHAFALNIASLSFDYDGHRIRPEHAQNLHVLRQGTVRYRIQRQQETEQALRDQLSPYGFESRAQHPLDLLFPHENPALRALHWSNFLDHGIPELMLAGWTIDFAEDFNMAFSLIEDWEAELENSGQDWFEISLGFVVEGKRINLLPILVDMLAQMRDPQELRQLLQAQEHLLIPLDNQHWIKLESARLSQVLDTLIELYDQDPLNSRGNLLLSRFQGSQLSELLNDPRLLWKGADDLKELTRKLQDFQGINAVAPPAGLRAELRHYQQDGLNWLQFLREYQFNGVLADDMGLGKTLQALTHLLVEKASGRADRPSLVIAPTSLMSNWRRETEKFTPALSVLTLHGPERHELFEQLKHYDLILTTYPLLLRDEDLYRSLEFHYLILDEAQAIKNAKAKTTQAIYDLQARHRLCLTGTPMENHLGELWSMFHFLMPGFLGPHDRFSRLFRVPIEKQADAERQQALRRRLQPFMLRRTKEKVASELPPKTEIIRTVALEGEQRDLYETVRLAMDKKIREEISQKGFARSQIMILDALLKLRQVCCDPRLVKLDRARTVKRSAKLEMLLEMLSELLEEGRKVLQFSQFTSMLALIEPELDTLGVPYSKLTGQTRNREEVINAFQEGDARVFLISLKAGVPVST